MASSDIRLADAAERIADALEYWVAHHKESHAPVPQPPPPPPPPPAPKPAPVKVGEVPAGGMVPKEIQAKLVESGEMKAPGEVKK